MTVPPPWCWMARSSPPPRRKRFCRKKHDARFPTAAVAYCLAEAGLAPDNRFSSPSTTSRSPSSSVCWRPTWPLRRAGFAQLPPGHAAVAAGEAVPAPRHSPRAARAAQAPLVFLDHHESHAASAFFPSPFRRGRHPDPRRRRRVEHRQPRRRRGQPHPPDRSSAVSPFARPALLRLHLLLRLQGQQRRIQADGPGPLRPAGLRRSHLSST